MASKSYNNKKSAFFHFNRFFPNSSSIIPTAKKHLYLYTLSDLCDTEVIKDTMMRRGIEMEGKLEHRKVMLFAFTLLLLFLAGVGIASAQGEEVAAGGITDSGWIAIAAGIAMAGGALGAGWAISATGVAAAGATAEKPESFGRVLIFVALAEAIAIYGLLIAFMLWTKI